MLERMNLPSFTTAAAMSSHEDSMPRINIKVKVKVKVKYFLTSTLPSAFYFTISLTAFKNSSISLSVLKYPGLTRTAPVGYVPAVLWACGGRGGRHPTLIL